MQNKPPQYFDKKQGYFSPFVKKKTPPQYFSENTLQNIKELLRVFYIRPWLYVATIIYSSKNHTY